MFAFKKKQTIKPKYLAIAGSPFQLLCMLERSWRDGEHELHIIIADNGNEKNLAQIRELLVGFDFARLTFFRKESIPTGNFLILRIFNFRYNVLKLYGF